MITDIKTIEGNYFETNAVSYSFLKSFAVCPANAFRQYDASKEMDFGTALHDIILEKKEYYTYEKIDGRYAAGKAQKIELEKMQIENKSIIEKSDYDLIKTLEAELLTRKIGDLTVKDIIITGIIEHGYICKYNDVDLRVKPDSYLELDDRVIILDLKTIGSVGEFYWNAKKYKYDWQAAIYSSVISALTGKPADFIFAVMEKKAPYGVKLIEIESESAEEKIQETIEEYKKWKLWGANKEEKYKNEIEFITIRSY